MVSTVRLGEVQALVPLYDIAFRSRRYLRSASCQLGISIPCFCKLLLDRTEYFGRRAGRTKCSLVVGRTMVFNLVSETISRANSNHEQSPRLVACTIPLASDRQS